MKTRPLSVLSATVSPAPTMTRGTMHPCHKYCCMVKWESECRENGEKIPMTWGLLVHLRIGDTKYLDAHTCTDSTVRWTPSHHHVMPSLPKTLFYGLWNHMRWHDSGNQKYRVTTGLGYLPETFPKANGFLAFANLKDPFPFKIWTIPVFQEASTHKSHLTHHKSKPWDR